MNYAYEAGIWNDRFTAWSQHRTLDGALRAARRYARGAKAPNGDARLWCGGVREAESDRVAWVDRKGKVVAP